MPCAAAVQDLATPAAPQDTSKVLALANIRNTLIRQEDTIIFNIIERAQFATNERVYVPGGVAVPFFDRGGRQYSLLEFTLRETEQLHGKLRRYTSPDEHAFYQNDLPGLCLPPISYDSVLAPCAASININSDIMSLYLQVRGAPAAPQAGRRSSGLTAAWHPPRPRAPLPAHRQPASAARSARCWTWPWGRPAPGANHGLHCRPAAAAPRCRPLPTAMLLPCRPASGHPAGDRRPRGRRQLRLCGHPGRAVPAGVCVCVCGGWGGSRPAADPCCPAPACVAAWAGGAHSLRPGGRAAGRRNPTLPSCGAPRPPAASAAAAGRQRLPQA
jgi:hypothetical protein